VGIYLDEMKLRSLAMLSPSSDFVRYSASMSSSTIFSSFSWSKVRIWMCTYDFYIKHKTGAFFQSDRFAHVATHCFAHKEKENLPVREKVFTL
jgi:hypothetical protein